MCTDQNNLKILSKWAGKSELSRKALMDKLQSNLNDFGRKFRQNNLNKITLIFLFLAFLPPNIMLPPRRLETLLAESIEYQCEKCPYHNFKDKFSIDNWCFLRNHECSK